MITSASGTTIEGKPFCTLEWGEQKGQMSPDEMRRLGMIFLATAEAAEVDAALLLFLRFDLEAETGQIATLLSMLRGRREQARDLAGDEG